MTEPSLRRSSPGLLVSVRSTEEAETALAGGADLIDVKEPLRGSLGKADDEVIAAVVREVAGRRPVSAALGELAQRPDLAQVSVPHFGVCAVKFGLSGYHDNEEWQEPISSIRSCVVAVAYADWRLAEAPRPERVIRFAIEQRCAAVLLDTWNKAGAALLDWVNMEALDGICRRLHEADIPVALAGALGESEIRRLLPLRPDWLAVRGSACRRGERGAEIDAERVRQLAKIIHQGTD
jgi:uncharacterized protein (UPF0264 family)